jgi:hypothetical protein
LQRVEEQKKLAAVWAKFSVLLNLKEIVLPLGFLTTKVFAELRLERDKVQKN